MTTNVKITPQMKGNVERDREWERERDIITLKWNKVTFYYPEINLLFRFWQELYWKKCTIVCDVKPITMLPLVDFQAKF